MLMPSDMAIVMHKPGLIAIRKKPPQKARMRVEFTSFQEAW
jgi:hypothetical protein